MEQSIFIINKIKLRRKQVSLQSMIIQIKTKMKLQKKDILHLRGCKGKKKRVYSELQVGEDLYE